MGGREGGKGLDLTGNGVEIEQFHIYKVSHKVPISNQTPLAPEQRCEGGCWRLITSLLFEAFNN